MSWTDPLVIMVGVAVAAYVLMVVVLTAQYTPSWRSILVGLEGLDPRVVQSARQVLSVAGGLLATALVAWVSGWRDPRLAGLGVALTGLINVGWGVLDKQLKPLQNVDNPPPVAGGGDRGLIE